METCRCGGNSTAFLFIDVCNTPVNANVFHHFCRTKDMQIKKIGPNLTRRASGA